MADAENFVTSGSLCEKWHVGVVVSSFSCLVPILYVAVSVADGEY